MATAATSSSTCSSELSNIQVLVQQAASMVERLEKGILHDAAVAESLVNRAQSSLLDVLQGLGAGSRGAVQPTSSSNVLMQTKRAESLLMECNGLTMTIERCKKRIAKDQHAKAERERLLSGLSTASYFNRADATDTTVLAQEAQGLSHSRRKVQQIVEESHAVLSALRGQSQRMVNTNDKVVNMLEVLGVSNQTILSIVRTNRVDAWLVYTGMLLLVILMWYLWTRE